MRLLIHTAAGHRNLGDELILAEEVRLLLETFPDARIRASRYGSDPLLSSDAVPVAYFPDGLRRRPFLNVVKFFRSVWETFRADAVVVGGGGLFYDNEAGQSFDGLLRQWRLRLGLARFFRKPAFFYAVGVYCSDDHARALAPLLSGPGVFVSVRDESSRELLRRAGVEAVLIRDPVHRYRAPAPYDSDSLFVGLALRTGYLPDDARDAEAMVRIIRERGYEPVFCSHSLHESDPAADDARSYRALADALGVRMTESLDETLALYPRLRMMVSMRLHASILSLAHGLPFLSLSYSAKTDALLDFYGHPYRTPARGFDPEEFARAFDALDRDRRGVSLALLAKAATIAESVREDTRSFFSHGLEEAPGRRARQSVRVRREGEETLDRRR